MTTDDGRRNLVSGFWATSLATLGSRALGLARDIATAALLGLGEGGVMDALVVAFRAPNLLRRTFGEGALAASFIPVFSAEQQRDARRAWQLLSVLATWLAVVLVLVSLAGVAVCGAVWWLADRDGPGARLAGLTAVLLPYMVLICLAAQAAAALQALSRFRVAAASTSLLNVCWLAAVWFVAPWFAGDKLTQAYVISAAIVASGVLQLAVLLRALRRLGFRFEYDWAASREAFWRVGRSLGPIALAMAVTQLNTLVDSLIAWGLAAEPGGSGTIGWLGHAVGYPMQAGAAAAIYYGERFYQLPVGMLGLAVATVIYPALSRHAARGEQQRLAGELALGLRLVTFLALPAGVGMLLLAGPLASVLFEHGAFTAEDARRAAATIACYASGVWAFSAIPLLVRGFYAQGNRTTPLRLGLLALVVNVALDLLLVWPLAERGLALATSIAAGVQAITLALLSWRRLRGPAWRPLASSFARAAAAVLVMALAVLIVRQLVPIDSESARWEEALWLALAIVAGAGVYLAAAWTLGMEEPRMLLGREMESSAVPKSKLSTAARAVARRRKPPSGDDFADGLAEVDGQPLAAGHFQAAGFEAQLVQHRGVHVSDVVAVLDGVKAQGVGRAVGDAPFQAAAGHHDRESKGVMVAAVAPLRAGRAAKLGADHDQRFVEQSALLEVFDQGRDRAIDLAAVLAVIGLQPAVGVPRAGAAVAAVKDLHEADAPLDQPSGHQALAAERLGLFLVEPIQRAGRRCFHLAVDNFGHGGLHAKGQLVRADAGQQGGVVRILDGRQAIQPIDQCELGLLLLAKHVAAGRGKRKRILGVDAQLYAAVLGPQVVGAVRADAATAVGNWRAQHDEPRQVFVDRSQAIVDPRADRGELAFEHVAAGVKLKLRAVVVVGGPHRADDRQVVGTAGQLGPPVADLQPAGAMLLKADLRGKQLVADVAIGIVGYDDPQVLLDERRGEHVAVRRVADLLAGELGQCRLGVEAFQVAHTADEEDPDHALGARANVRDACGEAGRLGGRGAADAVAREHFAQRQAGEAHAHVGQEGPAVGTRRGV